MGFLGTRRWMSALGQNAKYSQRADDFRLAPMNGHHQAQTPRPKSADSVAKLPKCRGIKFPEIDQTSRNRRTM